MNPTSQDPWFQTLFAERIGGAKYGKGTQIYKFEKINHAIGSKPALAMLPACFINPADVTLMTVPGYPVAGTHTKYSGGEVHNLPLLEENAFLPDLHSIPAEIKKRAKL